RRWIARLLRHADARWDRLIPQHSPGLAACWAGCAIRIRIARRVAYSGQQRPAPAPGGGRTALGGGNAWSGVAGRRLQYARGKPTVPGPFCAIYRWVCLRRPRLGIHLLLPPDGPADRSHPGRAGVALAILPSRPHGWIAAPAPYRRA